MIPITVIYELFVTLCSFSHLTRAAIRAVPNRDYLTAQGDLRLNSGVCSRKSSVSFKFFSKRFARNR